MVTPEEIRKKALAKYPSFMKYEFVSKEEDFFPLVIRCDKSIDFASLKELEQGITCLYSSSKEKKGYGYEVDMWSETPSFSESRVFLPKCLS